MSARPKPVFPAHLPIHLPIHLVSPLPIYIYIYIYIPMVVSIGSNHPRDLVRSLFLSVFVFVSVSVSVSLYTCLFEFVGSWHPFGSTPHRHRESYPVGSLPSFTHVSSRLNPRVHIYCNVVSQIVLVRHLVGTRYMPRYRISHIMVMLCVYVCRCVCVCVRVRMCPCACIRVHFTPPPQDVHALADPLNQDHMFARSDVGPGHLTQKT